MDTDTPNFDPLARIYRWMEYLSFGPMLERCRFRFLSQCSESCRALVLGDGDGRFTARLLAAIPAIQVDAIDASAAMLSALRRRVRREHPEADARLSTTQADLRRFTPSRIGYDLVVSHFFLDCLTEEDVSDLVERLLPHLSEDAIWLVSEFSVAEKGWRRAGSRLLIRFLYFVFFVLTRLHIRRIPNYAEVFRRHGFYRQENANFLDGLLVAEVWKRQDF
ncbi:MAG TPA: class I SAM-dependent methyltransferase [Acidobacteriaceae bacterium]|nr:class I SAM-dependent methyltransferase [Terriglobia bacterium]HVC89630.1 class I SAM-dependent methyltransferase [Acidobacteriaceae bacterium]